MSNNFEEYKSFFELVSKEEERKKKIEADINGIEQELADVKTKYEVAVINDQDDEAESFSNQMQELENQLKRYRDKLELLDKRFLNEKFMEQANKALQEINDIISQKNDEIQKLKEKYLQHRQEMLDIAVQISKTRSGSTDLRFKAERIANLIPRWAKDQHDFRYDQATNKYKYNRYVDNPTLPELTEGNISEQIRIKFINSN